MSPQKQKVKNLINHLKGKYKGYTNSGFDEKTYENDQCLPKKLFYREKKYVAPAELDYNVYYKRPSETDKLKDIKIWIKDPRILSKVGQIVVHLKATVEYTEFELTGGSSDTGGGYDCDPTIPSNTVSYEFKDDWDLYPPVNIKEAKTEYTIPEPQLSVVTTTVPPSGYDHSNEPYIPATLETYQAGPYGQGSCSYTAYADSLSYTLICGNTKVKLIEVK